MSNTPVQEPPAQELSSGSGHTLPPRPLQPISDPSASKRVCFYKSGDYKFSGHRMVINARTFKTFDALLDTLSKKVPLPFGVRTVTTPRGTHLVKALDDLHDGGSYVCSDQKRVKPLNLDEVNRRQVPWNTTRPQSAGRRRRLVSQFGQFGRRNDVNTNRPAKVTDRVAVRTPKRLVVIKNRDPNVKRTIVVQRRTAPTFDALLDYLSQILQFPVLKLYTTDGRRVDGLAGLILCSGIVVAAGNEPFRLANYNFQGTGQMAQVMYMETVEQSMLQHRTQNNKSLSSGRGSRNFSLSSERYIVNQINKSRNGSMNGHPHHHNESFETEVNHHHSSVEPRGSGRVNNEHQSCIVPHDDDIEKSFRINQDGSMTVEMKVRLTIKEEEMLHWTTTLSRSSLSKGTLCASISESGNSSPDSNNANAKDSSSISESEMKEENHPTGAGKCVGFNKEQAYEDYSSTALGKAKTGFKRTPTPGPRHVMKKASIESVKTVTESGVQESTLGHYSYMEKTTDGETTEGYCVIRQSSSSNRPIPKPRKTASAGTSNKGSHSSIRSSGVAEVLQIQNNGMEVTETVMHIYESQGCYDNYYANEEYSAEGAPLTGSTPAPESKPSIDSQCCSSSNDCDIDFSRQPPTAGSLQRQKEEMLSLSSEPITPTHDIIPTSSRTPKTSESETKKKTIKPARSQKGSTSTSSSDKKQKESIVTPSKNSKHSSTDKLSSNASVGKKTLSSSESANGGRKSRGAEKPQIKKVSKDERTAKLEQALLVNTENVRRTPPKRQSMSKAAARDNGHNVNTPTVRPQMKKNMSDILQPKKSHLQGKKTNSKPKSMTENRTPSPKKSLELNESFSMPSLNPSPSDVHQYVENWLEKVYPDPVPYAEEAIMDEPEPQTKVVFQIGCDSESDEQTECQTHLDESNPSPADGVKKSTSCLSVPHCYEPTALQHNDQYMRGLCVSMPSVRVDPVHQENRLRSHKSAEAIGPTDNVSSSSASRVLESRAKIKPVLRELCSSIHCIRSATETNTTSNLEKSNSLPDFSAQVATVFGSSCKAFMSFLSVMTLRDNLTGSLSELGSPSRSSSEAMLMLESLQKISAIEDEDELRASLTDLQSRASSQLRERWKDFQIMRERLESEPLSPKVSETEFALDVFSEGGDAFEDIDELMDELNMPQDLRAEIASTIHQARSFYPVEESTFVETEKNQSDSEEDLEKFVEEFNNETKPSPEPDITSIAEDITTNDAEIDNLKTIQAKVSNESEQEAEKELEKSQTEKDEPLSDKENAQKEQEKQVEEEREEVNDREDWETKETDDSGGGDEETERERDKEAEEGAVTEVDVKRQENSEKGSVEEESVQEVREEMEEEMTVDEEEEGKKLEVQEARQDDSVKETDQRKVAEETEEEEEGEEEKGVELRTEERQVEEIKEEADEGEVGVNIEEVEEKEEVDEVTDKKDDGGEVGSIEEFEEEEKEGGDEVIGEKDEGEEVKNITEEVEEEKDEGEDEVIGEENEEEEVENIEKVEKEEEETDEVIGEENTEEEVETIEEVQEEEEAEADEVIGEENTEEEVENIEEVEEEEAEADEVIGEENAEEEVENIEEVEEEEEEAEADEVIGEENAEEDVETIEEVEEEEEAEADEVIGEENAEEEVENIEEVEEEEEAEADEVIGEENAEEEVENIEKVEDEEEERDEVFGEENAEEEVENIEEVEEEGEAEANEVIGEENAEEEVENIEEVEEEEEEEETDEVIGEKDEGEEVGSVEDVEGEGEDDEAEEVNGATDKGKETESIEEVEEEEEEEEEADEIIEEKGEGEEVENMTEKAEEEEKDEEADAEDVEEAEEGIELVEENEEEEVKEVTEEEDAEGKVENIEEMEEEEEEADVVTEKDVEEAVIEENKDVEEKDEEEEVESEENNDEEEEREEEVVEDGEDVEVLNIEESGDEEEEGEDIEKNVEEEEKCGEGEESEKDLEKSLDEESVEEEEAVEENGENMKSEQMLDKAVGEDDEENDSNEGLDEQESNNETEEVNATEDADSTAGSTDCINPLEEASYLQQQSSEDPDTKVAEHDTDSSAKSSSEDQYDYQEGGSKNLPHPVEISQELLDFVNSALQSSSLKFTYDTQGNIRIEPDNTVVSQTKQIVIPKRRKDNSYGLKRLPSPSTSDLSDYRPETSESGGYKTQESVDIVSESGEESSPLCRRKTDIPLRRTNVKQDNSNLSTAIKTEVVQKLKSAGSFSSSNSGTKASKEDLSYFSAASSQKADTEPATEATQCISFSQEKDLTDGVLIDRGRWLLKENHLIRKSPPVSLGMYSQLDSTSLDTGQENTSEDSPSHCKTQHNPLAAISSSELEEMAKPQTPKCTYYNMPHGSDSDPFLDDSSVKSAKDASSVKGRGFRVSPTIDTSKTWASRNGSLSSFASVEFKLPDRKVHPEGESSAVTRPRRTSSGGGSVLQAQDSLDTLRVRCGQYCPIL